MKNTQDTLFTLETEAYLTEEERDTIQKLSRHYAVRNLYSYMEQALIGGTFYKERGLREAETIFCGFAGALYAALETHGDILCRRGKWDIFRPKVTQEEALRKLARFNNIVPKDMSGLPKPNRGEQVTKA